MQSSNDEFLRRIGQQIRAARINAGLTQQFVADRLGLTQQTISKIEKGRQAIRVDMLNEVAEICSVPVYYLLGNSESDLRTAYLLHQIPPASQPYTTEMLELLVKMHQANR